MANSKIGLIGIDWGTSSFRAYLVSAAGDVAETISTNDGILNVPDRDFAALLSRRLAPWLGEHPSAPLVLTGMIGSRNGWVEAPYLPLPCGADDLARSLSRIDAGAGRTAYLAPGLAVDATGRNPDVMRGEETQIIGAIANESGDATVVLPGTHTKWVDVQSGRITDFRTYMTGEVYAALSGHTILGALAEPPSAPNDAAFDRGIARFVAGPADTSLLAEIFSARTLPLMGRMAAGEIPDYLSGLVIGAEIAHAAPLAGTRAITLIGRADLCTRYRRALAAFGRDCTIEPDGAAPRGQFLIAAAAGLLDADAGT